MNVAVDTQVINSFREWTSSPCKPQAQLVLVVDLIIVGHNPYSIMPCILEEV